MLSIYIILRDTLARSVHGDTNYEQIQNLRYLKPGTHEFALFEDRLAWVTFKVVDYEYVLTCMICLEETFS